MRTMKLKLVKNKNKLRTFLDCEVEKQKIKTTKSYTC